ncbi:MAG: hypothetical protein E2O68_03935 [Deltaproteobacteria bacterium]|nr:MAG: hypothetical protein E2O68_03935 [Deltaproteobacteria bacterium]
MIRLLPLMLLLFSAISYGAQTAYVKTARAVIYSDKELSSPIGYVRMGRKLRVGDVKRQQGSVLPVIISGRIAYIEIKNLALPESKSLEEKGHISHIEEEERPWEEIWLSDSHLRVDVAFVAPGSEWDQLTASIGNSSGLMVTIPVMWELRPLDWRWNFDIGMSVNTLSSGQDISMLALGGEFWAQYLLIKSKKFSLDLRGGYLLSLGGVKIRYSWTGETNNGSYWGYVLGAQARFFKGSRWELNLGFDWRRMIMQDLNNLTLPNGSVYALRHMGGISLFIGTNLTL